MHNRIVLPAIILSSLLASPSSFAAPDVCKPVPSSCGDTDFVEADQTRIFDCQVGTIIRALTDGKVLSITPATLCDLGTCGTDQCADTGTIVRIQHNSQNFEYRHLAILAPDIEPGALLLQGQAIGAVGQLQCTDRVTFELYAKTPDILRSLSSADYCPCIPNCTNKSCGSDGCGGECGECGIQSSCENGLCTCTPSEVIPGSEGQPKACGDNGCGALVTPGIDGMCAKRTESCQNYQCIDLSQNANTRNCTPKCVNDSGERVRTCGSDDCGGTCGACPPNQICNETTFQCECIDSCEGKLCGHDSCGTPCGECPNHMTCDAPSGQCKCLLDDFSVGITDCKDKSCGEKTSCGLTCPCYTNGDGPHEELAASLELRNTGGCQAMPSGKRRDLPLACAILLALAALMAVPRKRRRAV